MSLPQIPIAFFGHENHVFELKQHTVSDHPVLETDSCSVMAPVLAAKIESILGKLGSLRSNSANRAFPRVRNIPAKCLIRIYSTE